MATGADNIRRDQRDKRFPERNLRPFNTYALPVASDPGDIDPAEPAVFSYDAIAPSTAPTLGFFAANGAGGNAFVFGTGGNLIAVCNGVVQLNTPLSSLLSGYLDRVTRWTIAFNTIRSDFQLAMWADDHLIVRSGGTAPGGVWGDLTTFSVGVGMVFPAGAVMRYHKRLIPPSARSPATPRFVQ